ncbi:DsbA family protein [Thermasporomyces composti]|jgi:protein-disulfide isomerase|uniref:Protein-disulfide isomerase n=1 Tax=Thermasporomyces composti TaxID=696763 RepID=A0A3D9VFB8_THECX|nr:thioredoxin domain-containing protein [Thermasporomyces composti]REF36021.1 protein-disulfide isomerase [Thermasporomyces composti]
MSREDRRGSTALLGITLALTVVLIIVLAWKTAGGGSTEAATARPGPTAGSELAEKLLSYQRRLPDDPLAIGRADAPVVLIAYEDFRCPYCAKYATDIEPQLIERYVTSGVLRIEWRDFPVLGEESMELAKAARAAARQGKFWEFHDAVYAIGASKPRFSEELIQDLAREAGVPDLTRFNADRADPRIERAIRADMAEGRELGVFSTPTFFINTQPILGAQPLERFMTIIEAERATR